MTSRKKLLDTMRRFTHDGLTALAMLVFLMGCGDSGGDAAGGPRHVVLISMDTTRADHLGCYGGQVQTPHLDRMADEGVRFDAVTAAAPTTLASHTSIMTGVYPQTHGTPRNGFVINPENQTLAELLSDAGFQCAAFLGSFALESRFEFDQGFDHFDETFDLELDVTHFDQNQRRAQAVTDAVLAHLDESEAERRFLFVHYFDPHTPYDPPPPYDTMYVRDGGLNRSTLDDMEQAVRAHYSNVLDNPPERPVGVRKALGLSDELLGAITGEPVGRDHELAALYAGEISYLDEHLGRLLDGLDERGILEDALLVITADHGETFWEHADFWNHGLWVYDTTVRVPLIVRGPGLPAGRVVTDAVSTVDVLPTILDVLGLAVPAQVEGVPLRPAWQGGEFHRGPVFCEATQPVHPRIEQDQPWANLRKPKAVRDGDLKYIMAPYLEREELYNMVTDPGEREDLMTTRGAGLREHKKALRTALREWVQSGRPLPSYFNPDPDVLERLRELGYAGSVEDGE